MFRDFRLWMFLPGPPVRTYTCPHADVDARRHVTEMHFDTCDIYIYINM